MTPPCKSCIADKGVYDFALDCCLSRFLAGCPTKEIRLAHMERMIQKFGSEKMAVVREMVEAEFKRRRECQK